MSYFTVERPGCSFELERAEKAYPRHCADCGLGPCRHHKRDSAYVADGSSIFPPQGTDLPDPAAVVETARRNGWVFDRDGDLLTWLNTRLTMASGAAAAVATLRKVVAKLEDEGRCVKD